MVYSTLDISTRRADGQATSRPRTHAISTASEAKECYSKLLTVDRPGAAVRPPVERSTWEACQTGEHTGGELCSWTAEGLKGRVELRIVHHGSTART